MAILGNRVGFRETSAIPVVGTFYNAVMPNCLKTALNNSDNPILPGEPVVALVSQASRPQGGMDGLNPNFQVITKKATTVTGGADSTNVCGFMIVNSNDTVSTGGVGVSKKGSIINYAPLGQGAILWLEVHTNNVSGFNKDLDTNVALTWDTTNGGVKVSSGGADVLVGAKLIQGIVKAQKISNEGGVFKLIDCLAVAVQLS